MADAVAVGRLLAALWVGDFTRSVTGARWRTLAVVWGVGVLAAAWVALAVVSAHGGERGVPDALQLQVLVESALGTGLASASITGVLAVLLPSNRVLEPLLAVAPISRTTRSMAVTLPTVVTATALAPVVLAPLIASGAALMDGAQAGASTTAAIATAFAASAVTSSVIRLAARVGTALGIDETTATSVAAAATVAGAALGYRAAVRTPWAQLLAGSDRSAPVLVAVAALTAALLAGALMALVARTVTIGPRPAVVRWLRPRTGRPLPAAVLLPLRDPMTVSTLVLAAGLVVGARVGSGLNDDPAVQGLLFQVTLLAVPSAVLLPLYATDRRTSWRRAVVVPVRTDPWNPGRVVTMVGAGLVVAAGVVLSFGGTQAAAGWAWTPSLPMVWLCICAAGFSGVVFPSDLDLPGGGVLAAILAAALTSVPPFIADRLGSGAAAVGLPVAAGLVLVLVLPVVISRRRTASILA
ncbi:MULTISPECIES: hypothetical protein [unclassified Curtobacterium]|uniref:hypothetical protein n=1 Tax=unclassified Curtobacterium TaxID=257496 RepID=UPI0037F4498D